MLASAGVLGGLLLISGAAQAEDPPRQEGAAGLHWSRSLGAGIEQARSSNREYVLLICDPGAQLDARGVVDGVTFDLHFLREMSEACALVLVPDCASSPEGSRIHTRYCLDGGLPAAVLLDSRGELLLMPGQLISHDAADVLKLAEEAMREGARLAELAVRPDSRMAAAQGLAKRCAWERVVDLCEAQLAEGYEAEAATCLAVAKARLQKWQEARAEYVKLAAVFPEDSRRLDWRLRAASGALLGTNGALAGTLGETVPPAVNELLVDLVLEEDKIGFCRVLEFILANWAEPEAVTTARLRWLKRNHPVAAQARIAHSSLVMVLDGYGNRAEALAEAEEFVARYAGTQDAIDMESMWLPRLREIHR